jgi:hypothetical protein
VAGRLFRDRDTLTFNYGRSYLARGDAIALYLPELPLEAGAITPEPGLNMAGCLRDGAPDAWGRRVILNRTFGIRGEGGGKDVDIGAIDELTYLLESGSDRIGALDFQVSPTAYAPRTAKAATLEELLTAAEKVEHGIPLSPELDQALYHGSSLGGARPKAMVSALTLFGLDEMMARYSSYADLAQIIRHRFTQPKDTLRELFGRLVFNILCGNTDDHARNHAAFWDGEALTLTPAYDICPQSRTGNEASQAMLITGTNRRTALATCIEAAPNFLLNKQSASQIIGDMLATVRTEWEPTCDEAGLSAMDRNFFWGRIVFNPSIFDGGYP